MDDHIKILVNNSRNSSRSGKVQIVNNDCGDWGKQADKAEEVLGIADGEPLQQPILQVDDHIAAIRMLNFGQTSLN
jgi:hypothetical protein